MTPIRSSIFPAETVRGGSLCVENLLDELRRLCRWRSVRLVTLHDPDRLGGRRRIRISPVDLRNVTPARGEIGLEVSRFDECHVNAKGLHLVCESFAVTLHRELACAVERLERKADQPPERAH